MAFPTTGLIADVTTYEIGNMTYVWNGSAWNVVTTATDTTITRQGNTFNGVSELVQTDGTGKLPAIDGSQLTGISTVTTLSALTDTTIATPTDGQALTYDTATSKWINATPTSVTVNNTLTSTSTTEALSANMGKTLEDAKAPLASPSFTGPVASAGQLQLSKGADVVSAPALPILTDGNYFDVTGTTTITSINTTGKIGAVIKLHFDGILTLTHHATDLILPSAASITTAAGDEAEFVEYAAGDFRCTSYTKADGTALVVTGNSTASSFSSAGLVQISSATQNSLATTSTGFQTVQLSATTGFYIHGIATYTKIRPYKISNGTIAFGVDTNLANGGNTVASSACRVSDTEAIICYYNSGLSGMAAVIVGIDATTLAITQNTAISIATSGTNRTQVEQIDASNYLLLYAEGTLNLSAVVLSLSGTTITKNTPTTIDTLAWSTASTNGEIFCTKIDTGLFHIVYALDKTVGNYYVNRLAVSGITVTAGTAIALTATRAFTTAIAKISTTESCMFIGDAYNPASSIRMIKLTDNGTTITASDTLFSYTSLTSANNVIIDASLYVYVFRTYRTGVQELYTYIKSSGVISSNFALNMSAATLAAYNFAINTYKPYLDTIAISTNATASGNYASNTAIFSLT